VRCSWPRGRLETIAYARDGLDRVGLVRFSDSTHFGNAGVDGIVTDDASAPASWIPGECYSEDQAPLRMARIPLSMLSRRPPTLQEAYYTALPTVPGDGIENRFTDDYLVYGGSEGRWRSYYRDRYPYEPTEVVAVPVDDPDRYVTLPILHSVERLEVFGDNVILDGHKYETGLTVSSLDLRDRPRIADTVYLDRVFESEGRSHAFNFVVDAEGGGQFGLPTIFRDSSRPRWNINSDIHFFEVSRNLDIRPASYWPPTRTPKIRTTSARSRATVGTATRDPYSSTDASSR